MSGKSEDFKSKNAFLIAFGAGVGHGGGPPGREQICRSLQIDPTRPAPPEGGAANL